MPEDCVFCKIAQREIPVEPVFESDEFIAFRDMHPQAPVHALLIPKKHFSTIMDIQDEALLGRAMLAVQAAAKQLGIAEEGFRTVLNTRDNGGQTVYHVHWHLLGGRFMQWPPG
jgi:histidine triad (HIT) family protein